MDERRVSKPHAPARGLPATRALSSALSGHTVPSKKGDDDARCHDCHDGDKGGSDDHSPNYVPRGSAKKGREPPIATGRT